VPREVEGGVQMRQHRIVELGERWGHAFPWLDLGLPPWRLDMSAIYSIQPPWPAGRNISSTPEVLGAIRSCTPDPEVHP
jgi:hypothetical protein